MKKIKKILALVMAMAMVLGMSSITAFAAGKTITVTVNANGGKFENDATTYTETITVDDAATTVDFGQLRNVPRVIAPDNTKAFDFWADSEAATSEKLTATISEGKATFYAVWKNNVPTNNRELDGKITVSGLETNDVVNFYQILKWDQDAVDTKGWVAAEGFTLTDDEIKTILNIGTPAPTNPGISAELAAKLAKQVADNHISPATGYGPITASNGAASKDEPAAGLYMALITPGQSGVIYNPVFVAADYDGNETNSWALVNLEQSYSPTSIAKKTKITLDKTAETTEDDFEDKKPETVAAGDTVTFRVETTVPTFAKNYTSAKFFVEDHLSKGLTLNLDSVKVLPGWYSEATTTEAQTAFNNQDELTKTYGFNGEAKADGYTVTKEHKDNGQDSWKVDFATNYLLRDRAVAQKITIVYTATVTTDAPRSINIENNTAEVHYSNSPTDGTGNGTLKDETKHYTFDLDANILGPKGDSQEGSHPWQTTEVVKVGLDKDGNEITQTKTLHGETYDGSTSTEQKIGALQGAEFVLYKAVSDGNGGLKFEEAAANIYTNNIMKADYKIVSDENGRLTIQNKVDGNYVAETNPGIRGLDIGTYYLKETKAPDGYIKAQDPVKIEIIAPQPDWTTATSNDYWELKEYTETIEGVEVKWSVKELKKYEVEINDVETADYTFTNAQSVEDQEPTGTVNQGDTVTGAGGPVDNNTDGNENAENAGKITNTQGVELPSTGGIGTTIFYVAGTILVIFAGVVLVTRRRMNA